MGRKDLHQDQAREGQDPDQAKGNKDLHQDLHLDPHPLAAKDRREAKNPQFVVKSKGT